MFEFDHISASVTNPSELTAKLTAKSREGWDVVSIYTCDDSVIAIIKRAARFVSSTSATTGIPQAQTSIATPSAAAPANWYPDPSGRFELRYWNGEKWTEHVSTGGQQSTDAPIK